MNKFCKNCGAELQEGSNLCPYCGTSNGDEIVNNDQIKEYNQKENNHTYTESNQNSNMSNGVNQNMNNNENAKFNTNAIIAFVCSIIGLGCCGIVLGIVSIIMRNNFFKTYKRI